MSYKADPITLRVTISDWREIPSEDWLLIQSAYAHLLQCVKTISSDYAIATD